MRSRLVKALTYAVGFATVGAMVIYLVNQRDLMDHLRAISLPQLALLTAVTVAGSINFGTRFRGICEVFDVRLTHLEALGLAMTNSMLNYAIPLKGGMVLRAAYMKQRFGLTYTDYGALLASSQLLALAVAGVGGLFWSLIAFAVDGVSSAGLIVVFVGSVIASVALFAVVDFFDFTRIRPAAVGQRLQAFSRGFSEWRRRPWSILRFSASAMLAIAISGLRLIIVFAALGFDAPPLVLMVVASAVWLSGTIPITPGNLGIAEGVIALTAGLLGIDPRLALLAALVERATGLIVVFAMGVPFSSTLLLRTPAHDAPDDPEVGP